MKLSRVAVVVVVSLLAAFPVFAADAVVTMSLVNEQGVGKCIGTITISEGPDQPAPLGGSGARIACGVIK